MRQDEKEDIGLPDDQTEDSIVTAAKWRFGGRVAVAMGTTLAGFFAAIATYYGALL